MLSQGERDCERAYKELENKYEQHKLISNNLIKEISHVLTGSLFRIKGLISISKIDSKDYDDIINKEIEAYTALASLIIARYEAQIKPINENEKPTNN